MRSAPPPTTTLSPASTKTENSFLFLAVLQTSHHPFFLLRRTKDIWSRTTSRPNNILILDGPFRKRREARSLMDEDWWPYELKANRKAIDRVSDIDETKWRLRTLPTKLCNSS